MQTGESAGCEALRAEQAADDIRSSLLPGAKRPATTSGLTGARAFFPRILVKPDVIRCYRVAVCHLPHMIILAKVSLLSLQESFFQMVQAGKFHFSGHRLGNRFQMIQLYTCIAPK